jgi:hypothetical protein
MFFQTKTTSKGEVKCEQYQLPLTVLLVSSSSWAVCPQEKTTVLYLNGVDVKKADAVKSKDKLDQVVTNTIGADQADCITFDFVYNTNEPLFLDFLEAGMQKAEEEVGSIEAFWETYLRGLAQGFFPSFASLVESYFSTVDTVIEVGEYVLGDQLNEHLVRYRQELNQNRTIVLVGHSQGNLYASAAWNLFTTSERERTHVIAVATPSNTVPGGGPYTTLHKDVLAATIFAAIGALPANTEMTEDCGSTWLCHGFKEAYLLGAAPRARIVSAITDALAVPVQSATIQGLTFRFLFDYGTMTGYTEVAGNTNVYLWSVSGIEDEEITKLLAETTSDANGFYTLLAPVCARCYVSADDGYYSGGTPEFEIVSGETYTVDVTMIGPPVAQ